MKRTHLFVIGKEVSPRVRTGFTLLSFLLPLALWSLVSYVPFIWHPLIRIGSPRGSNVPSKDQG